MQGHSHSFIVYLHLLPLSFASIPSPSTQCCLPSLPQTFSHLIISFHTPLSLCLSHFASLLQLGFPL
ncbi:hypothetical protein GLYMA_06G179001v4 [Glycine max]|nr:hypothetical protein GLYMA_06G179001v4 [Glycine max]KAH1126484.1 hypothetical protein GYH30_015466 [Glycine max]